MPLQLPQGIPNLNVNIPSMADAQMKGLQLRDLMAQQQMRPVQLQIAQQQQQQLQLENQQRQIELQSQQNMMKMFQSGEMENLFDGQAHPSTPAGTAPPPGVPDVLPFDPNKLMGTMAKNGILPKDSFGFITPLLDQASKMSEIAKNRGAAAKDLFDVYAKTHETLASGLAPIAKLPPDQQALALSEWQQELTKNPPPGTDPGDIQYLAKITPDQIAHAATRLGIESQMANSYKAQAEAKTAEQHADIVQQLSTPEALVNPGTPAAIQEKINDPKTNPSDLPRLEALLPKTAVAQHQQIVQKQRETAAVQAVNQGDPDAMGKLLASRVLTIDEMKVRGLTPQFQEAAITAAQRYDPTFKAPEAAAQGKIAASPAYAQFFGNTDSLLVKGGTLDQLGARAAALGNRQIPKWNTLANWTEAALGSGPQAAFAATALGVADDYSKVMTGSGQGSDTSRQQALDIIGRDLSPEGRAASIDAIRQAVTSQRNGRIGTNPYLRDMYPNPIAQHEGSGGAGGAGGSGLGVSLAAARRLPQYKGMTDAQITSEIEKYGHKALP